MESITIQKFDLKTLCHCPTIVINAKRGSGKSVCIKHLMYHYHTVEHYPAGVVCSLSEQVDPFYREFFPDIFIFDSCLSAFKKILARQKKIKASNERIKNNLPEIQKRNAERRIQNQKIEEENKQIKLYNKMNGTTKPLKPLIPLEPEKPEDGRLLLVLDDVLSNAKEWGKSDEMKEIIFNGRHYDITLIIAIQDTVALGPGIRNNIDYVFLFNNDIKMEVEKLWKYFAGIFDKCSDFQQVLNKVTEDHGILVIIRRNPKSNDLKDKVARFKASIDLPPFKFGCQKFNKVAMKYYNDKWLEEEEKDRERFGGIARKKGIRVRFD